MSITRSHNARKVHRCDGCARGGKIQPGDRYLTHTALSGDDYYHDALDRTTLKPANQPIRIKECAECATRYGRAELLEDETNHEAVPTGAASPIPEGEQ